MSHPRPPSPLVVALGFTLLLAACTSSTEDGADTTATPPTVVEQETTTPGSPTTTTEAETTTTTQAETTTTSGLPPVLADGSGSGDDVVEFSIIDTAAAVTFTHDGTGKFSVWDLGEGLQQMDLLVNTIGSYTGTRPLQWKEATVGFEITADGNWSYEIVPMEVSRHEDCPFSGDGDDVIIVND